MKRLITHKLTGMATLLLASGIFVGARASEIVLYETGFETSEGYVLGDLHGQIGWSGDEENPDDCQVIDDVVLTGAQAIRINASKLNPLLGLGATSPALPSGGPDRRMALIYEMMVRIEQTGSADYAVQTIDSLGEAAGTVVLFTFLGDVFIDYFDTDIDWTPGQWMALRIQVELDQAGCPARADVSLDGQALSEDLSVAGASQLDGLQFLTDRSSSAEGRLVIDDLRVSLRYTWGDFNDDGHVNLIDFATFARCYSRSLAEPPPDCLPEEFALSDLNGDGAVNLVDFASFAVNYTG